MGYKSLNLSDKRALCQWCRWRAYSELCSLANGVPFLYFDFKFNWNTKNKFFPIPVSVCCPLDLFNLSIDDFNETVEKCTAGHNLDELSIFNKRLDSRKALSTNVLSLIKRCNKSFIASVAKDFYKLMSGEVSIFKLMTEI